VVTVDEDTVQWAVAISLLIALLTLLVHTLLCYITRRWAFMAANRSHDTEEEGGLLPGKRKRLKRRKPRPKFRTPLMVHYSSSTDCSL
jgi:hypothetical protein